MLFFGYSIQKFKLSFLAEFGLVHRRVIIYKKVDPDISGNPHDDGHEKHQRGYYRSKGDFKIGIEEKATDDKGGHPESDTHAIAHVHCAEEKRRLNFIFEAAVLAVLVHLEHVGKVIGIRVHIHFLILAFRAGACGNAVEFGSFFHDFGSLCHLDSWTLFLQSPLIY